MICKSIDWSKAELSVLLDSTLSLVVQMGEMGLKLGSSWQLEVTDNLGLDLLSWFHSCMVSCVGFLYDRLQGRTQVSVLRSLDEPSGYLSSNLGLFYFSNFFFFFNVVHVKSCCVIHRDSSLVELTVSVYLELFTPSLFSLVKDVLLVEAEFAVVLTLDF